MSTETAQATSLGQIITVRKLLSEKSLTIPQYQRPYKWTEKNVHQLFTDISTHMDKSSYRLGTIVFHQEENHKNIVDGQQRTITLLLAVNALTKLRQNNLERNDLKDQLLELGRSMISPRFKNEISKTNIRNNFRQISSIVCRSDFSERHIDFLLNKCEVVTFALSDISEAFQFFDSQNARGRDLEPHDLLKAYHLREFSTIDKPLEAQTVFEWERSETEELASLFSQYLYRIRNWSRGKSAHHFSKNDTELFKGINMNAKIRYPYAEQLRIAHHFTDDYNHQHERQIDGINRNFPFHLDQIIINGRRFFEMIEYYQKMVKECSKFSTDPHPSDILDKDAKNILTTLNEYKGRKRTGDQYVRMIFDCLLIYYIDKFHFDQISRAISKIFIWAYRLRLEKQVVQLASIDKYVLENNLFILLKDAIEPDDFISYTPPPVQEKESEKTKEIAKLFREMQYL